jgi:hypothetical protein
LIVMAVTASRRKKPGAAMPPDTAAQAARAHGVTEYLEQSSGHFKRPTTGSACTSAIATGVSAEN